jgi:hypothetical protein
MLKYNSWSTRLKALRCKLFGKTDFEGGPLHRNSRTGRKDENHCRLVPPGARVIEFGLGMGKLQRHLDPSCQYTPSPQHRRGACEPASRFVKTVEQGAGRDCLDGLDPDLPFTIKRSPVRERLTLMSIPAAWSWAAT